ncbi:hypothetical protein NXS19_008950 [Fusarium pseudograminearum]|nr:hypothetical protein NXS19_008950 [Fusarium pseudograminearum]
MWMGPAFLCILATKKKALSSISGYVKGMKKGKIWKYRYSHNHLNHPPPTVIWKLVTLNTVYIRHLLDSPLEIYKTSLDHPQTGRVVRGPRLSADWSTTAYQEGLGRDLGCNLIRVCGTESSHPCFLWYLEIFVIPFVGFILHTLIECVNGTLNLIRLT